MTKCNPKRYGVLHLISDILLTCFTGGLWLIRIYVRESRRNGNA